MTDDNDKPAAEGAPGRKETGPDSRHERLKLALRDNLKRRKSQAKARSSQMRGKMTDAPSNHHEEILDDDTGSESGG
jgi:hypothetical protein